MNKGKIPIKLDFRVERAKSWQEQTFLSVTLKRSRFELFEVNELRGLHTGFFSDFNKLWGFKKTLCVVNGSPHGEVNNSVLVVLILEDLV